MSYNKNKPIIEDDSGKKQKKNTPKPKKKGKAKVSKLGLRKKEKDPRFRIIFGIFLMLISIFVLVSYIAYLISYDITTGIVGDKIGQGLTELSFGLGSLYLIFLLFLLGCNLTFKGPKIDIMTLFKYSIMSLIWLPLLLATIMPQTIPNQVFYGMIGLRFNEILSPHIRNIGIYILLIFILITYILFTFNIKLPTIKERVKYDEDEDNDDDNDNDNDNDDDNDNSNEDEDEDVEIIVKHIPTVEDISEDDDTVDNHDDQEDAIINLSPKDIDLEVTNPTEEKQAIEIGEHFGLDTNFDPKLELSNYKFPPLDLLKDYGESSNVVDKEELEANKKRIVDTLANYNIAIDKIKATIGPTVTLYEIIPAAGVRISKIKGLQDDIALCLSAIGIRIIAPIPGKGTVGIEVPNQKPQIVSMRSVLGSERFQKCGYELPFGIGKTISNESYVADLAKMPHILMAGATGQGKSVGINAIISSLLYSKHPAELKFVLVDPKKVELSLYKKIERHFLAKLPDAEEAIITDVRKVVRTLNSLCIEMDNRYELLKDAQVRNIKEYNAKFISRKLNPYDGHRFLPYIVLVVDEFADLIMTAGKEVEAPIARLAQLARAIGIHLIIATQRPSVNIITGTIKANFPARIAFRVISRVDSGTILDTNGADQLIGRGDMLLSTGNDLVRLQCAFIDTPEVEEITDFIGNQRAYPDAYNLPDCPDEKDDGGSKENLNPDERDPLFEEAAYIIVQTQQGSTSMLQRKLKLGYNRAGRIIDQLEKAGIVGPFAGSKQREVRIANEMALEQYLKDLYMDDNSEL